MPWPIAGFNVVQAARDIFWRDGDYSVINPGEYHGAAVANKPLKTGVYPDG